MEEIGAQLASLFEALPKSARREIIRVLVEDRGLLKSEIARKMGVTPSAVTRFMRGDAAPSPESLAKLYESLEPEDQAIIIKIVLDYIASLLRTTAAILANITPLLDKHTHRLIQVSIEEVVDEAASLLEAAEGYSGAHSSHSQLGERFSSTPSAASKRDSMLRSRL
ncbi:helix-turn-helix domain protein [Pyrolobus fumarii 1A]|uniref:Helix-turn-helix domain protein n=1 Tax=Pyrolobus fumarii (strain DSM 11204 / 1A) TaxID=694429 RepID=G0EC74_PYRF1|nr:helix-turn-helix transcriptional regulator [Pyrolobus fumarii]AEM39444.1 helix-turn-helix domain protein [Pyrolobus fumarii 1A]